MWWWVEEGSHGWVCAEGANCVLCVYISEHKVLVRGKHLDEHLKSKYCTVLTLLQVWIMCMRVEVND